MADNRKRMEDLLEQQNREKLFELNRYVFGGTLFKGSKSSALSLLNKFRLEGDSGFCDVTLEIEGRQLTAHHCVLAANSYIFRSSISFYKSAMRNASRIKLSSPFDFDSMSLILDYFYMRKNIINDDNVMELLDLAFLLSVFTLEEACVQHLSKRLSSKNCLSVLKVAEKFGASDLAERANKFIKTNFSIVVNNEEFVSVSQRNLLTFLDSDDLQVDKKEEIYDAVLKWVRHDEVNRVSVLPELLENLRKACRPSAFAESKMADNSKTMENLFEQQNREKLLELNRSVSSVTMFQERKSSSLSLLNKFRLKGDSGFCDVILEVEGMQLTTHRCILAANSQFFYTMFSSGMRESNQKLLSLQTVDFESMSLILNYFYMREIVINDDNELELLDASSFLLVTPVKNACIRHLSKRLSSENCFSILQVAEQFGASDLVKMANNFIKTNFSIVVNNEEFVNVSRNHLLSWIVSDDIQVLKEEEIYQAVLKWVRHDEVNRFSVLPELLENLRKGSLPEGFLESEMTKEPLLIAASCEVEPARKKKKRKQKCGTAGKSEPLGLRPSTELHNVMIGIGTDNCRKAFCYVLDKKETLILSDLSLLQYHPQVAFVGWSLYLVGGLNYNDDAVQRVCALCFDDAKNLRMQMDWKEKSPSKVARLAASLVELNGLLYYIGGYQIGSGGCNIVECYNPEIDEWSYCGRLNTPRCKSGCVVAKGHIYVIGGGHLLGEYTSESVISSVERYDTERDSWSYVAPMKEARSRPGCVYWNNKIYVIGGIVSTSVPTTSCEVYSPITDEWQAIANLPYPYSGDNNVIIIKNQVTVPIRHETANFSYEAVNYSVHSNAWRKMKHLGPSDKVVTFTLCTTQLPTMILQRLPRVLCLADFFEEWKDSDEDTNDFWGGSDDSSSFCGWHSARNSEDFDMEPSDGDAYW